ncbi:hypothetical protein [Thermoflavimicrobium dichotomicum]|uniref:Uncharacterized protein n=1 Tax=Thermoflavimicrobium dichotomicum TaxID=46223 RepID=A0A1I3ULW9_9BACL|nr:hypothetical protein [Thermoflavimicrobium dichotomicum]SFJ82811.1 hypothetical protein SAMN05421852_12524 [Thermoflavimicrobium dichotomicum]
MGAIKKTQPVIIWKETEPKSKPGIGPLPSDDEIIIACEDVPIEFKWHGRDVREFIHMWEQGLSLLDIARSWEDRNPDDVIFLWEHALYKGWIKDRPGGIWGRRRKD